MATDLPQGKVLLMHKGEYNALTTYEYLDLVTSEQATYLYVNQIKAAGISLDNETYWRLVARTPLKGIDYWTATDEQAVLDAIEATNNANEAAEIAIAAVSTAGWEKVQMLVRLGRGPEVFPVGHQMLVKDTTWGDLVVEVLGHDHHKKPGEPTIPTMTMGFRDCVISAHQFSSGEMTWGNTTESPLPVGTYHFTLASGNMGAALEDTGTYQFATAQAIPPGGGWRCIDNVVVLYDENRAAIQSDIPLTAGSSGTNLGSIGSAVVDIAAIIGTFNVTTRARYGSNNYEQSALRQYLLSDAAAGSVWESKTPFDLPPSWSAGSSGFLANLPSDFLAVLSPVDILWRTNNVFEYGYALNTQFTLLGEKVFLLSRSEVFGGSESSVNDGTQLAYYTPNVALDRIKFNLSGVARAWWLRAPAPSSAHYVRGVTTDGAVGRNYAYNTYGVAPAFVIY